jgi:hypothetical protein
MKTRNILLIACIGLFVFMYRENSVFKRKVNNYVNHLPETINYCVDQGAKYFERLAKTNKNDNSTSSSDKDDSFWSIDTFTSDESVDLSALETNNASLGIDTMVLQLPDEKQNSIETVAKTLCELSPEESDRAKLLYAWVAHNIHYDDYGFNTGNYSNIDAASVFENKKSVCSGYSNLVCEIGKKMGLNVVQIGGYSKGYGYKQGDKLTKTDHAWNAIQINGNWQLIDATWGSGYGANEGGKLKSYTAYDPKWFSMPAHEFLLTHLPENAEYQFMDEPITLAQYEQFPYVNGGIFNLHFDSKTLFKQLLSGELKSICEAYNFKVPVEASQIPLEGVLTQGRNYSFTIKCKAADEIYVMDGETMVSFKNQDGVYQLTHAPRNRSLILYISMPHSSNGEGIVKYSVSRQAI